MISDYANYRGKCKEMSEQLARDNPSIRLVRGYYHCPMWGKQQHWWCEDAGGNIIDPTVNQFPTKGAGAEYEEFDGNVKCSECGKGGHEEEFKKEGRYVFCSSQCYGKFVGLI